MNAPDELRDGSRAAGWLNKLLSFVKMTRIVEGVGYRLIQTTRGTALEIQPGKGGGATGTPSWKGEWQYLEDAANLEPEESPRPRTYSEGDMVIRGGEQVIDIAGHPLILAGAVCGTWIARRSMSLGEAPGEPSAAETAAGVFSWDLVSRFASPTIVARNEGTKISLETSTSEASVIVSSTSISGSVRIDLTEALGKSISLRKIRVCQNNVMKNMIILASEAYD